MAGWNGSYSGAEVERGGLIGSLELLHAVANGGLVLRLVNNSPSLVLALVCY